MALFGAQQSIHNSGAGEHNPLDYGNFFERTGYRRLFDDLEYDDEAMVQQQGAQPEPEVQHEDSSPEKRSKGSLVRDVELYFNRRRDPHFEDKLLKAIQTTL